MEVIGEMVESDGSHPTDYERAVVVGWPGTLDNRLVWTYEILMEGSGLFQQGFPSIVLR